MTESRIHLDVALESGASLELPEAAFRHLVQVLRMQAGDALTVFNGGGGEFRAQLAQVGKRSARLDVGAFIDVSRESPLHLTLVQGLSKGERMDYTVQKCAELGVMRVLPVITERCNVNLGQEREAKRFEHWRGVMVSACEQSGRTRVPELGELVRLDRWLAQPAQGQRFVLDPEAPQTLAQVELRGKVFSLVIGPEGGLSAAEIAACVAVGCEAVRMGPRILRTETAGAVALALLQARAGDLR